MGDPKFHTAGLTGFTAELQKMDLRMKMVIVKVEWLGLVKATDQLLAEVKSQMFVCFLT